MANSDVGPTMPVAYLGGIASRSERYMRDHWARAKDFIDPATLAVSAREEERQHVDAQQAAGLDFLSPAYVTWEDLLRPFCAEGGPVAPGQLWRYFETNTFFRQPLVTGQPKPADAAGLFRDFVLPAGKTWTLTLPSPWDFALRAKDERASSTVANLALEFGQSLQPVVKAAVAKGARLIRFHDPSIAYKRAAKRDVGAFAQALATAAKGHIDTCTLHITNGDPFTVTEALTANPLGGLSIEDPGRQPPKNFSLAKGTKLTLALIRGEDSTVESPAAVARRAAELAAALNLPLWGVTNGWDLDHVPHAIAQRKIAALGQVRLALEEVAA
jgi:methionine synthase II (cobalamin-independent)